MSRPPLQIGTWGKISRDEVSPGVWRAMARFRDFDGVTRKVEARAAATSKNDKGGKAERLLIAALTDRAMPDYRSLHGRVLLRSASTKRTALHYECSFCVPNRISMYTDRTVSHYWTLHGVLLLHSASTKRAALHYG